MLDPRPEERMSLGQRQPCEQSFWVTTQNLPKSPGHPFYERLNKILDEGRFDEHVESLCKPHYAERGRPSIPPGTYFRMLFVGYFEGLTSQRGIAWRCSDSLALRAFLGVGLEGKVPDHSTMTLTRQRLPFEVFLEVFLFALKLAHEKGLLRGKTVAVDATMLEANAAMKAIVRRDTGEDWKEYLRRLMQEEEGVEDPSDEELRRFDKKRNKKGGGKKGGGKKVSNKDWASPADPDARIMRMKDGRTHLAYKAEHVVDLDSDLILSAEVHLGDMGDAETLTGSFAQAQDNLVRCGSSAKIKDVVGDKGYFSAESLAECVRAGWRTYVPEPKPPGDGQRRWVDKPDEWKQASYANRRRMRGERGKRLQRLRSEKTERSFAHTCETGGARRTHTRGLIEVDKRYVVHAAARNLGVILRKLFGVGTPRSLQDGVAAAAAAVAATLALVALATRGLNRARHLVTVAMGCLVAGCQDPPNHTIGHGEPCLVTAPTAQLSTGC
jgi:transposase